MKRNIVDSNIKKGVPKDTSNYFFIEIKKVSNNIDIGELQSSFTWCMEPAMESVSYALLLSECTLCISFLNRNAFN